MKTLGICLGASTISITEAQKNGDLCCRLIFSKRHEGKPRQVLKQALETLPLEEFGRVAVTGRRLCDYLDLSMISEPRASEYSLKFTRPQNLILDALVSCGGETFMVYVLNKEGMIQTAYAGGKCASGTGEFFLQQIQRMNISLEEAIALAKAGIPFKVSGRCSVFCKSDCTHALNRAEPIANVVAGLCKMLADKLLELLSKVAKNNIMLVGGVAQNPIVMGFLKSHIQNIYIPKEAGYFEALGASLWALDNHCKALDLKNIFKKEKTSFSYLPSLKETRDLVTFNSLPFVHAEPKDECIIGLDVGSTTTKAVVLRIEDEALVASVYLRTLGQPVEASRNCYRDLLRQLPEDISIVGLGVTGSGRQIAGLHALTKDIINEIIAHARAAVYFDKEVDTIFEIGGQDAKYTYLINAVACDYAMNEACSAGTGSFLEESCRETLGIKMEEIAEIALQSDLSPNFNDQCSAFISSDIKTAIYEGIKKEDIVAGLVYSICMNYLNRVKGQRPVGSKIFMQGGVCYIEAVPLAMARLIKKPIVVPAHPGLMGAFGAALEVKSRLNLGLSKKEKFDLEALALRKVELGRSFICQGKPVALATGSQTTAFRPEGCDRKCAIVNIKLEGKTFPFGGACNKYYNLRLDLHPEVDKKDLVSIRQKLLFEGYPHRNQKEKKKKTIGLNLSFLTYNLFPLYRHFFERLDLEVILPSVPHSEGIAHQGSNFCYPASLSHGLFLDLIQKNPDYIFLPHISEVPVENAISKKPEHQSTCFILQAETYYLRTAFKNLIAPGKLLTPVLNFSQGYSSQEKDFVRLAKRLGRDKKSAVMAYTEAVSCQEEFELRLNRLGKAALENLKNNPDEIAVVLFGRSYNSFCPEANLGIPRKFASRQVSIIPFDSLLAESGSYQGPEEFFGESLTWACGQMILRVASFVKSHSQLFGAYITNFSCGPDSFLLTYFRELMQDKPSLTLEIDSHTQDAGINTRIEAFLDVVQRYRHLKKQNVEPRTVPLCGTGARVNFTGLISQGFNPAKAIYRDKRPVVISSDKKSYSISSHRVNLLIPSMGDLASEALAAVCKRVGINAISLAAPDFETLQRGRMHSSCKECLPLILVCGSLLKYLEENKTTEQILVYFLPTVGGNCRFSQYSVFLKNLIRKLNLKDLAIFSLTSEDGYTGLGNQFNASTLKAVVISDCLDDVRNTLDVLAKDKEYARSIFKQEWQKILQCLRSSGNGSVERQLVETVRVFKAIPLKYLIRQAKFVSLLGEIFVRKELFSRHQVVERLKEKEIITRTAPVLEWLFYVDYLVKKGMLASDFSLRRRWEFFIKSSLQRSYEKRIKAILAGSGLYTYDLVDIERLIRYGKNFVGLELTGEPIIVIGSALSELMHSVSGIISIGPFSCLPTRVTEAILSKEMQDLPFLSVEVDGNPLPQVMEAKIEVFCLQVERLHQVMLRRRGLW